LIPEEGFEGSCRIIVGYPVASSAYEYIDRRYRTPVSQFTYKLVLLLIPSITQIITFKLSFFDRSKPLPSKLLHPKSKENPEYYTIICSSSKYYFPL
jgi:hypothetical protein